MTRQISYTVRSVYSPKIGLKMGFMFFSPATSVNKCRNSPNVCLLLPFVSSLGRSTYIILYYIAVVSKLALCLLLLGPWGTVPPTDSNDGA